MNLLFNAPVPRDYLTVKAQFTRELFLALKPPGVRLELKRFDGCSPGNEVHLELHSFGLTQQWKSLITKETLTESEWSFVDEGKLLPWPLKTWQHHHRVLKVNDQESLIIDDINFDCGSEALNRLMYPILWASFSVRPAKYKKFFQGS